MATLEIELEDLLTLDAVRTRARQLRDAGVLGLLSRSYEQAGTVDTPESKPDTRPKWDEPGDLVELALMLSICRLVERRNIKHRKTEEDHKAVYLTKLNALTESDVTPPEYRQNDQKNGTPQDLDCVPIFRLARLMQEYVDRPGMVFDKRMMMCYYHIVHELYSVGPIDSFVGSARAGKDDFATAFITGECARAILSLRNAIDRTAELMRSVRTFLKDLRRVEGVFAAVSADKKDGKPIAKWCEREGELARLTFFVSYTSLRDHVLFKLPKLGKPDHEFEACMREWTTDWYESDDTRCKVSKTLSDLLEKDLKSGESAIGEARNALLKQTEKQEKKVNEQPGVAAEPVSTRTHREKFTATARLIADDTLALGGRWIQELQNTLKASPGSKGQAELWEGLEATLRRVSRSVEQVLKPAISYVSAVLDRELTAAELPGEPMCDPPELTFAALTFGAITKRWDDPRLLHAARVLEALIGEGGTFPLGRPFHSLPDGSVLHVAPSEVTQAFARLIERVEYPLSPDSAKRLVRHYERLALPISPEPERVGFGIDLFVKRESVSWWASALSIRALDRIVRMIDEVINRRVRRHFTCKERTQLDLQLEKMLRADYGIASWDGKSRIPLLFHIQRMRAHLKGGHCVGVPIWEGNWGNLWSVVLYGPPGTGKTGLMEALASTCQMPLINVTPSDIIMSGVESLEMRARTVMKALSLVTDCVILFDEFDEFLRERVAVGKDIPGPRSMFEFITAGMLPKFRELHRAAERQRFVYGLATNMIHTLDDAAIREGRFDLKIGVYPPDVLSRTGALLEMYWDYALQAGLSPKLTAELEDRIAKCVWSSRGAPMTRLGRPGWLGKMGQEMLDGKKPKVGTYLNFMLETPERSAQTPEILEREFDASWTNYETGRYSSKKPEKVSPAGKEIEELYQALWPKDGAQNWGGLAKQLRGRPGPAPFPWSKPPRATL